MQDPRWDQIFIPGGIAGTPPISCLTFYLGPSDSQQNTRQSFDCARCYGKHWAVIAQKVWDETMREKACRNWSDFSAFLLVREFKITFCQEWLVYGASITVFQKA